MAVLGEALSHFVLISAVFYHVAARQPSSSRCVSVVLDHAANALKLVDGYHPNSSVAWGNFTEIQQQTGWNYLTVSTSPEYNDTFQAYAAGLVEGFLTADYIYMEWFNTQASFCHTMTPDCEKIKSFLGENLEWMKQQVELNPDDPYFYQMGLVLNQVDGVKDGYMNKPHRPTIDIDPFGFLLFQAGGDLDGIEAALKADGGRKRGRFSGHCSALIKLLPGNKDLYVSHVTWTEYGDMLRIVKKYNLPFRMSPQLSEIVPGREVTFSSYPGPIISGDDYYITGSGLVTMETTIGNENPDLWKFVKSKGTVLEWMRTVLANRLASSVTEWTDIFSKYNSGTYNNEWMVVDYKHFTPGQPLPTEGVFALLDQIPGQIESKDLTQLLSQQTYWPSYNIPYFPDIFKNGGFAEEAAKYGSFFIYDKAPRANIFRRDHHKVTDLASMIKLMRYNDFQHDPFSRCNCTPPYSGENGISARSDLNPPNGTYPFPALGFRCHGGTDMKVTSSDMYRSLSMVAVSGPTHDQQPVFQWSKSRCDKEQLHMGQPDLFNFDPVKVVWEKP
ncbi:putative phospholipase B-like 2 [Acanthaster planci]|uniref:Phospholipase B-like n=1 Tax=Acanthaster planci TaxID=133434 RepID=A0A8B7YP47_ACAPL|nr:putative phospholipase B-like 2 [Acanthaster planci]